MSESEAGPTVPPSFKVTAIVALVWNVMGVLNFIVQMNPEVVASMPDAQRVIIEGRPAWATAAFALAVFGGTAGAILLLLRRAAAIHAFGASLVGVVVQMLAYIGLLGSEHFGLPQLVMYAAMPLIVAGFLFWYANSAQSRQWIS